MQYLISESPYRDLTIPISPRFSSDWDAADMLPVFMQTMIYKPELISLMSSTHYVGDFYFTSLIHFNS